MANLPGNSTTSRWLVRCTALGLVAGITAVLFACSDRPTAPTTARPVAPEAATVPAGGWNLTEGSPVTITSSAGVTGIWEFPTPFNVGTGLISPFLRVQNNGTEAGFNTNANNVLDDKSGSIALALNRVPVIKRGNAFFRQIILDANESNSDPDQQISIDRFDLWVCNDPGAPNFNQRSQFTGNSNCVKVYDLNGKTAFAFDSLTSGSGNALDYDILISEQGFLNGFSALNVDPAQCPYMGPNAAPCGLWLILDTQMGGFGGDWVAGATFEEYSTIKQPYVTVSKTATPTFTRTHNWDIDKVVNPTTISMFTGESQDATYSVVVTELSATDGDWKVTGQVTIQNPSDGSVSITAVNDLIQPGNIPVTVDCGSLPRTLAAGATLVCDYTKTFASNPGAGTFQNTVTVELDGLAIASGHSDAFSFTTPTTEVNKTVDVTDTNLAQKLADDIARDSTFTYKKTFTCDADEGSHQNIAKVIGDSDAVLDQDDATVTVDCGNLSVDKTVNVDWERKYKWTVDKSVTPATWDLFTGDQGTSHYTITVTRSTDTDKFTASGTITVSNSAGIAATNVAVADCVQQSTNGGGAWTDVKCQSPVATGQTIPANGSAQFNYSIVDFQPTAGALLRNHVTVTRNSVAAAAKDVAFSIPANPTSEIDENASVTDTYGGAGGPFAFNGGGGTKTYDRTFTCDADKGKNDNTATLTTNDTNTQVSDGASVVVNCYGLGVTKTATTEWTRTWTWTIDKTVDPTFFLPGTYDAGTNTATIQDGEVLQVKYLIKLDATSAAGSQKVSGKITITNPNPALDATLTGVADVVTTSIAANVVCPTLTVPKGGSLDCTYSTDLPDGNSRSNTATATLQNHKYVDGNTTDLGTTDFKNNPAVAVTFSSTPTVEVDDCVTVKDLLQKGGIQVGSEVDVVPGTYCAKDGLPKTFSVIRTFGGTTGIPVACGDNTFDNTATFTTDDTNKTGSDPARIIIHVDCGKGCTLTQGYWKTHNASFSLSRNGNGPPLDATWGLLDAPQPPNWTGDGVFNKENEPFFLSGQTWFQVFNTAPQGNAYYILAVQYMAAVLNGLAGADQSAVSTALAQATTLFKTYTPAQIAALKGKNGDALRQQFIDLAGTLGKYNEGLIGPGHCTENQTSL
ncbi:MAG TPA: hypothetical protein VFQ38_02930 [Longimicrobiales bacterium]|nr:hypothetical protein [Longimicrobiales bacterium]